jgi:hypothetical protein
MTKKGQAYYSCKHSSQAAELELVSNAKQAAAKQIELREQHFSMASTSASCPGFTVGVS